MRRDHEQELQQLRDQVKALTITQMELQERLLTLATNLYMVMMIMAETNPRLAAVMAANKPGEAKGTKHENIQ